MTARNETSLGGPANPFPPTRWSLILDARDRSSPAHQEAINHLCRQYWKPVYVFLRIARSLGNEEAKDLTQEFFIELLEGGLLGRYAPQAGSFRGYLQGALRFFLMNRHEKDSALKRGGGRRFFSLDDAALETLRVAAEERPETAFDREWARTLLDLAVEDLRRELAGTDKEVHLRLFERYELGDAAEESPTYSDLAQEFGIAENDVSVDLAFCRRRLRRLLVERIRDTVAGEGESVTELERMLALLTRSVS